MPNLPSGNAAFRASVLPRSTCQASKASLQSLRFDAEGDNDHGMGDVL